MKEKSVNTVRPFDILMNSKGKEVEVKLKSGIIYKGKLKAFDIHMNIVLYETTEIINENSELIGNIFIRGDTIVTIKGL